MATGGSLLRSTAEEARSCPFTEPSAKVKNERSHVSTHYVRGANNSSEVPLNGNKSAVDALKKVQWCVIFSLTDRYSKKRWGQEMRRYAFHQNKTRKKLPSLFLNVRLLASTQKLYEVINVRINKCRKYDFLFFLKARWAATGRRPVITTGPRRLWSRAAFKRGKQTNLCVSRFPGGAYSSSRKSTLNRG